MNLLDLLRALPGLVVLGLLPGLALVSLIPPSMPGWQRLALAPGLSAGAVGVLGLLYHDVHVPFELSSVLPVVGLLAVAAALRGLRKRATTRGDDDGPAQRSRSGSRMILVGGLTAGLISAGILASALRVGPLPIAGDAPVHGAVTHAIAVDKDVLAPVPVPVAHTASVRPRSAFEATAALVAGMGGLAPVSGMLPLALLAVVLLPLSLSVLMFEATRSARMAAVMPLLAVGLPLTTYAVQFGEYPYLLDLTLVVPMAVSGRRLLLDHGGARREAALLSVLVASVWAIHGLEVLTAVVVGAPWAIASARGIPWRALVRRAAVLLVAAAAGAAAVTLMTRLPAVPPAVAPQGVHPASQASYFLGVWGSWRQAPEALSHFVTADLPGVVPALLYALGVVTALRVRGLRWALASHLLLLLVLVDVGYAMVFGRLWTAIFPWSVVDRVLAIQWFVVPLLMCWGLFHLRAVLPVVSAARRPAAVALAGLAGAAAIVTPVVGGAAQLSAIRSEVAGARGASEADWAALIAMDRVVPPGTVVLTRGPVDPGVWVDSVSRGVEWSPLSYSRSFVEDRTGIPVAEGRARAMANACTDPAAARAALSGVGAVFLSIDPRPGAPIAWEAACIAALPGVKQVLETSAGGSSARIFTVDPAALAGQAQTDCLDGRPCR